MVRHGFRTREGIGDERLPVGKCGKCERETYQVLEGSWLHWATLTADCPKKVALESLSDDQEGGIS